jgi:hypothetical protein
VVQTVQAREEEEAMSLREKLEAVCAEYDGYTATYEDVRIQEMTRRIRALLAADDAEPDGEAAQRRELREAFIAGAVAREFAMYNTLMPPNRFKAWEAEALRRYPDKEAPHE